MKRAVIAGAAFAIVLALFALAVRRALEKDGPSAAETSPATTPAIENEEEGKAEAYQGFLYGRIATVDGATFEGRLRWGGVEEAFWGDSFNGVKAENRWAAQVAPERLPKERRPIAIFGFEIAQRERPVDLGRQFMARFGDIARLEARGRDVRVSLKSGTVFDLDRLEASDFDDGVRVWDGSRGVVDLDSLRIKTIELLPTARLEAAPTRLHGTVSTRQGDFTGFVEWNREKRLGSDELNGESDDREISLPFDTLRSIARHSAESSPGSSLVTLADGRELVLSGGPEVGQDNRGITVDDRRYGRVLVAWDAFERLDFSAGTPGDSGPAYGDFPAGRLLTGSVTTRAGHRFAGRLVYDLDESETTETLDAPSQGVNYSLPFARIASIAPRGREEPGAQPVRVALRDGEALKLERSGDLGEENLGMLVFVDGQEQPEYVPWAELERIDFDHHSP